MQKQMHWFTIVTSIIVTAILLFAVGSLIRFVMPRSENNKLPVRVAITVGAPTNEPEWQSPTYNKMYKPLLSQQFTALSQPRLTALLPGTTLVEKKTDCLKNFNPNLYLRTWGGLCAHGYWLENPKTGQEFRSRIALQQAIKPISTGEQAAAFIGATDFLNDKPNDIIHGAYINDPSEPQNFIIFAEGADVCNDGDMNKYLYRVTNDGTATLLATWPRTTPLCNP